MQPSVLVTIFKKSILQLSNRKTVTILGAPNVCSCSRAHCIKPGSDPKTLQKEVEQVGAFAGFFNGVSNIHNVWCLGTKPCINWEFSEGAE
ncbi:Hypothetical predicted protein [Podarcis lilfordi]|uniref:Uncharacterized protein n=1 Tax=Podarcis lilfordi TaxID=74358 RepID=A0AA35LAV2_9SAUR|nr:Hypothetical predicted protein [Podarcis lilfordi]